MGSFQPPRGESKNEPACLPRPVRLGVATWIAISAPGLPTIRRRRSSTVQRAIGRKRASADFGPAREHPAQHGRRVVVHRAGRRFKPPPADFGHSRTRVPGVAAYRRLSGRISAYIRLGPPLRDQPSHRSRLRNQRNEPLDRTQEVGGSNPPSFIDSVHRRAFPAHKDRSVSRRSEAASPHLSRGERLKGRRCGSM